MSPIRLGIYILVAVLVWFVAGRHFFVNIPEGHQGVVFRVLRGGVNKETVYGQGLHVKWPWNRMIVYDLRLREEKAKVDVLSRNGLSIMVELSYRFQPNPGKLGYLVDEVGPEYQRSIVEPEIRASTRAVVGRYLLDELYSSKRGDIQDEIFNKVSYALRNKYIYLDAILVKQITLPASIQRAIEAKLKQEQESQEYEFRLAIAQKEAERLRIESEGKAAAFKMLAPALSDNIIREKGIEALQRLAGSPNTKIIIMGGKNGVPLMID